MADIINFEHFKAQKIEQYIDDTILMLPLPEPEDIPIINKLKSRVGVIIGYSYIHDLVKVAVGGKNIINKLHINSNELPYNIVVHLKETSDDERKKLGEELKENLKIARTTFIKEQLFFLRTKILQTI